MPPELASEQPSGEKKPEKPAPPVTIKKIEVTNGAVDYLDRKTPVTPVLTKMREIDFTMNDLTVPFADNFSDYALSATVPVIKARVD